MILAIDPGPEQSAVVIWHDGRVVSAEIARNDQIRFSLRTRWKEIPYCACEAIACYGMPVGAETFQTCMEIGRFIEIRALQMFPEVRLIYRREVKMHLCGNNRAKDGNIRQALIDKLGPVGTKKQPGPCYGIASHLWAALAVAITALETQPTQPAPPQNPPERVQASD